MMAMVTPGDNGMFAARQHLLETMFGCCSRLKVHKQRFY